MKQMLKHKLKDVPEAQRDMIVGAVSKNPELFQKIAKETEELVKQGKDQNAAAIEVMMKYKSELQQIMGK